MNTLLLKIKCLLYIILILVIIININNNTNTNIYPSIHTYYKLIISHIISFNYSSLINQL